jgi:hypothetical protein
MPDDRLIIVCQKQRIVRDRGDATKTFTNVSRDGRGLPLEEGLS